MNATIFIHGFDADHELFTLPGAKENQSTSNPNKYYMAYTLKGEGLDVTVISNEYEKRGE